MQPWERQFTDIAQPAVPDPNSLKGDLQPWERQFGPPTSTTTPGPTREERRGFFVNRDPVERFLTQSRGIARSIPVIGNFVSETPEMREEERMLPRSTTAGRNLGGMAATAPLMAAGPIGSTVIGQMANMGARGAALNLADAHTSDNAPTTAIQNLMRGGMGALGGAAGAGLNRVLSPAGMRTVPTKPQPSIQGPNGITPPNPPAPMVPQLANAVASQGMNKNAGQVTDTLTNFLSNATLGGVLGHLAGGDLQSALYGAAAGGVGGRALKGYKNTDFGRAHMGRKMNPEDAAILNTIGGYVPTLGQ